MLPFKISQFKTCLEMTNNLSILLEARLYTYLRYLVTSSISLSGYVGAIVGREKEEKNKEREKETSSFLYMTRAD